MIAILGAGISGLTLGRLLPGSTIFEKSPFIGGPSRTIHYKEFHFDTGLHYLAESDPEVEEFLRPFLGKDRAKSPLTSLHWAYWKNGKTWPKLLGPKDLNFFSHPLLTLGCLATLYLRRVFPINRGTHQDFAIDMYGDLYFYFFLKDFIKKYIGLAADQLLLPEFQPRQILPLAIRILRRIARHTKPVQQKKMHIIYPLPWFGILIDKLAEGLPIRLSSELTGVELSGNRLVGIQINGKETIPCECLISTIPAHLLIDVLDPPPEIREKALSIRYRNLIYAVLLFDVSRLMDIQFAIGLGDEIFVRAFEPKNWGPFSSPPNKTSICFELYCSLSEPLWQMPDGEIIRRILRDFRQYVHAPDPAEWVLYRFPRVLPVFDSQFKANVEAVYHWASSFENMYFPPPGLLLKGNPINLGIKEALGLAKQIATVNAFSGLNR